MSDRAPYQPGRYVPSGTRAEIKEETQERLIIHRVRAHVLSSEVIRKGNHGRDYTSGDARHLKDSEAAKVVGFEPGRRTCN